MGLLLLATFGEVMAYIGYILIAILVLLVMITVHEAGHYFAGKFFGFGIEEFAIGFGPKLYKKQKSNGEIFSVRLLPIGGFCSFKGEDADSDDPTAFNNKKPWQRIIVLISGAFMNYLLALILIMSMFGIYGQTAFRVAYVNPDDGYAVEYSLQKDDKIIRIDGSNVYLTTDMMKSLDGRKQGDKGPFTVIRDGKTKIIDVELRSDVNLDNVEDIKPIYLAIGAYKTVDDNEIIGGLVGDTVRFGFFSTIGRSFEYSFKLAGTIFTVLGQLLTGKLGLSSMGGTVTTIAVAADAIMVGGFRYLLYIASFIGVNLAVFNMLPFPSLDGSRVVFCAIEWIFRKPVNRKVEAVIHAVGLILILLFAVAVDLQRCF